MAEKYLSQEALADLSLELAVLIHAGLDVGEGLVLLQQDAHGDQAELLGRMARDAEDGLPLSEVMERSGAFPPSVCGQIACGERTGRLEESLRALSESCEARLRLERKLRSALLYPAVLFLLMLVVLAVLLMRVLPVFEEVYASLGGGMTGLAGGLLRLGQGLEAALPWLLPLMAAATVFLGAFAGSGDFREKLLRRWMSGARGDRGVARKLQDARIAQTLSMGLRSGFGAEESLEMAEPQCSAAAAQRCRKAVELLENGEDLVTALRQGEVLPPSSCTMLAMGMQSGCGDTVIQEIARRITEDGEAALQEKTEMVEPAMVIVASVLVGVILLAVMLPLMHIMSAMG